MHPHTGPARPIGLLVALRVAPEAARHPDPGSFNNQLAYLVSDRAPGFVEYVGSHARAGAGEGARLEWQDWVSHDDAAGDLRTPRVIDDREPAFAHFLEQPHPRVRVPGFPRRGEGAQRGQVMLPEGRLAMRNQG